MLCLAITMLLLYKYFFLDEINSIFFNVIKPYSEFVIILLILLLPIVVVMNITLMIRYIKKRSLKETLCTGLKLLSLFLCATLFIVMFVLYTGGV